MTYKIFLCEERVPFLVNEMAHGKVNVIETEDEMTLVEITIDDAFDLLKIFHAGVEVGNSTRKKVV